MLCMLYIMLDWMQNDITKKELKNACSAYYPSSLNIGIIPECNELTVSDMQFVI